MNPAEIDAVLNDVAGGKAPRLSLGLIEAACSPGLGERFGVAQAAEAKARRLSVQGSAPWRLFAAAGSAPPEDRTR